MPFLTTNMLENKIYVFFFWPLLSLVLFLHFFSGPLVAETLQKKTDILVEVANYNSRKVKNHELAIQYINQAIKLQPSRTDLYYHRAFILGRAGIYQQAAKEFSRFVNQEKYNHAIRFRADCYFGMGMFDLAATDYTEFLKQYPKDGKVWSYLVEALYLMGNSQDALKACKIGISSRSHWTEKLMKLQKQILSGQSIKPHNLLAN